MRGKMRVAETLLQNEFGSVAKITAPQAVKRYFNYSGLKKYKDRKIMEILEHPTHSLEIL